MITIAPQTRHTGARTVGLRTTVPTLLCLIALPICSTARAQLSRDPLEECREPIRLILKFKWDGDRLALDRGYWDEWLSRTQQPLPPPEEFTRDVFQREERRFTCPAVIAIFAEEIIDPIRAKRLDVLNELRGLRDNRQIDSDEYQRRYDSNPYMSTGSGFGRISNRHRAYIRSTKLFEASIRISDTFFVFRFDENVVPHRSIIVREDDEGLQISFVGDSVLDIRQSVAGPVRLSYVADDQSSHFEADSFAELYGEHPEFVKEHLLPLVQQIGMGLPPEGP